MKKTVRNILILGLFFFMYNIGNVGAEKVCTYASTFENLGYPNSVNCTISDDETIRCAYTKEFYYDVGFSGQYIYNFEIINWKKDAVLNLANAFHYNGSCPNKIMYLYEGDVAVYSPNFAAINDEKDAAGMVNFDSPDKKIGVLELVDDQIKVKLNRRIEHIKDLNSEYAQLVKTLSKKNAEKKITNEILPKAKFILSQLDAHKSNMLEMKNKGELKNYKELEDQINSLIESNIAYFNEEKRKLELALANGVNNAAIWNIYTGNYVKPPGEPTNPSDDNKCVLFGSNVDPIVSWIVKFIYIFIPVFIIIASIIDFVGVTLSGEDKNFKKAGTKLIKRLIVGAIVIFLPILIVFIVDLSGVLVPYGIDPNTIFCSIF